MVCKDKQHTTYQIGMIRNASEMLCPAVRNPQTKWKFKDPMSLLLLLCFAPPVIHCKLLTDAMVHQKISNDMTKMALYLLMEAGWEMESIAEALGVSARSIERWEENYFAHSCVKPSQSIMGHPRLLTTDTIEIYRNYFVRIPLFLVKESQYLNHDQLISTTALHKNLQDLTLTHKEWRPNVTMLIVWILNMTMNYTAGVPCLSQS